MTKKATTTKTEGKKQKAKTPKLGKTQLAVLEALAKTKVKDGMTRAELTEATGKFIGGQVGNLDESARKKRPHSLQARGYVELVAYELEDGSDSPTYFEITPAGRKALKEGGAK